MNSKNEMGKRCGGHGRSRCWKMPLIIAVVIAVKSVLVFFLWNYTVPDLFHGPQITYLQALALLALCKLLFSSMGKGGHFGRHHGHHPGWRKYWLKHLSEEERENLRDKLRDKMHEPKEK